MSDDAQLKISVVGVGHVGLVASACLASVGHRVRAFDIDEEAIRGLAAGEVSFFEPGLSDLIEDAVRVGRLSFHASSAEAFQDASLVFLCVDTPNGEDRRPDLSSLLAATVNTLEHVGDDSVIINRCTAPVGTAERLRALAEEGRQGAVSVAVNPEFLSEGTAVRDFIAPDRIVIGAWDDRTRMRVRAAYEPIVSRKLPDRVPEDIRTWVARQPGDVPVVLTSAQTAELTKYAANAFLATKISFVNELAGVAEELGADITAITQAMGLDRRIGPEFLRAGIGWGGSCFPKDIAALEGMARARGIPMRMLRAANDVNADQPGRVIRRLQAHLGDLAGRRVCLLGLAFKANTDDLRNAPALELAAELEWLGVEVSAFDPVVSQLPPPLDGFIEVGRDVLAAAAGADAIILVTEWPEFAHIDLEILRASMRYPLLIDGRNLLDPERAAAAGWIYVGVGRSSLQADGRSPASVPIVRPPEA
jgi:UDPglucose 6-dehydrogenase